MSTLRRQLFAGTFLCEYDLDHILWVKILRFMCRNCTGSDVLLIEKISLLNIWRNCWDHLTPRFTLLCFWTAKPWLLSPSILALEILNAAVTPVLKIQYSFQTSHGCTDKSTNQKLKHQMLAVLIPNGYTIWYVATCWEVTLGKNQSKSKVRPTKVMVMGSTDIGYWISLCSDMSTIKKVWTAY